MTLLSDDFLDPYIRAEETGKHPLFDSFNGLGYLVYRRTYSRPIYYDGQYIRHEDWWETVTRVVNGANEIGADYTEAEAEKLFDLIWNAKALPGGRMLWQLGTDNVQRLGSASLVNCYYTELTDPADFRYLFEMLMLGGGVGFNVTKDSVAQLPDVNGGKLTLKEGFDVDFVVPDNREGWGTLLEMVLEAGFGMNGAKHLTYSVDAVRPEGTPIKTFGGTASGPGILVDGIKLIEDIFENAVRRDMEIPGDERTGPRLSTVDVLDIANIVGSIVVSGNVRRSAQIALGDQDDIEYLTAKRWDDDTPRYRAMSNNTVFVSDPDSLPTEFWNGYDGKGEAYGLFNVDYAQTHGRTGELRPDWSIEGVNPCGEIPLANRESCNLTELVLSKFDNLYEMMEASELLYRMQKAIAALPHVDPETEHITKRNMRLGQGVTGVAQATPEQLKWLSPTYENLVKFDKYWSQAKGWPTSIRLTTVKPSGTLSLLAGVTPGVHGGYSQYHIRRVRVASNDAVFQWAKDQSIPWEFLEEFDGTVDTRTAVLEFPCEFPEGTSLASHESALHQLRRHQAMQRLWADNAVSVTVTFKPEEMPGIRDYLREEWSTMKSVSFLPYHDHGYKQAPLTPIDEKEYKSRLRDLKLESGHVHGESFIGDEECEGGACPVR
ncbi:MAG: hypothetical protein DRH08_01505 [Deltaproteobacteria bacterium]|nr:MAG: hypothetical protein DRH08_01505 [Deltaproteobacteria bacterium]